MKLVKRVKVIKAKESYSDGTSSETVVEKRYILLDMEKVAVIGIRQVGGIDLLNCTMVDGSDIFIDLDTKLDINGDKSTLKDAIEADKGVGNV